MRFIHCTNSLNALIGILNHGFILNPCQRKTLGYFSNREEFIEREPQYFGMACVHGFKVLPNHRYWSKYGPFGIEMSPKWVIESGFHRVNYINPEGIKFHLLKKHFDAALSELDALVYAEHPDDAFRQMAYTNKNVAGVLSAMKWVEFLTAFEYMEPYENSFEREWRFVRKEPLYNDDSIQVMVDNLNNDCGWSRHIYPFKFECADVVRIHSEENIVEELRKILPSDYSGIEIDTTLNKTFQRIQSLMRLFR